MTDAPPFEKRPPPRTVKVRLRLPELEDGRLYRRLEVEEYFGDQDGSSDFNVVFSHFPRSLVTWEHDFRQWRDGDEMLLLYRTISTVRLETQIRAFEAAFSPLEKERDRVGEIEKLLRNGNVVFPVFMQLNDPQMRIIEGMHRSVALLRLQCSIVPAFLTGYREWFDALPDENPRTAAETGQRLVPPKEQNQDGK